MLDHANPFEHGTIVFNLYNQLILTIILELFIDII